jgi:deoxyhypusine monooxygenase
VCQKYGAMLALKHYGNEEAAKVLEEGYHFLGDSDLLRHDVMYWMGQMRATNSVKFLLDRVHDENERSIVRHEAGEALSNLLDIKEQVIPELEKHWNSEDSLLRSTVRVAVPKLKTINANSRYGKKYGGTMEPAEPFDATEVKQYLSSKNIPEPASHAELLQRVHEELKKSYEEVDEFTKYRLMYFLRDTNDLRSKEILSDMLLAKNRAVTSPLLRHELCFIMGQINNNEKCIHEALKEASLDENEHPVVRHEAILSFYDITKDEAFIDQFFKHSDQLLRESVELATKMGEEGM